MPNPARTGAAPTLVELRRDLHRHPEIAFQEHRTAALVATELRRLGLEVFTGLGGTGVVGKLVAGAGDRAYGFRAELDALPMQETNEFAHRSIHEGIFHGCGHDGHTAMLLGAARRLTERCSLSGTLYFIFQPAEEAAGGGPAMIADGLFQRCPVDGVFGMHNWPGLAVGKFAIRPGVMLAALATFDITITGVGGHGALPHRCTDPVVIGAEIIQALQSVVSRNVDPLAAAVLSVTRVRAGDAYNVIPEKMVLSGSVRYFDPSQGELVRRRMEQLAEHVAAAHNAAADVVYREQYPPLANSAVETERAIEAAEGVVGSGALLKGCDPIMASEDFAFMLRERPGAYILIGNGGEVDAPGVHHPEYDFNDDILELGVSYWVKLAELLLTRENA
jgi:hippurate hydrolase